MKTYYYVHTGHRIGLDRFRRAATIIKSLGDVDITLLSSDFRIAQIAREFGVEKCVGIDVVRNIPQIAHNGDQLIFDSEEANPIMLEDMRTYFSKFIRVSDDENDVKSPRELMLSMYKSGDDICNAYAINSDFFGNFEKSVKISYFFGDDDYEKDLEKNLDFISNLDLNLQLGFYYFLDYEDTLKEKFQNYFEFEEYDEMIQKTDILITASPQAVLESLASGGRPIYVKRQDYTDNFDSLFQALNIPIIDNYDKKKLTTTIETINENNYGKIEDYSNKIADFIKESLNL